MPLSYAFLYKKEDNMRHRSSGNSHTQTKFIQLDTRKCTACWKCLDTCSNNVIGRVNMLWHKHARFANGSYCTGCLKCVKICESNAIIKIPLGQS